MRQFTIIVLVLLLCGPAFGQTDSLRFPQQVPIYNKPFPVSPSPQPRRLGTSGHEIPQVPWTDLPSGAAEQFQLLTNNDFSGGLNLGAFKTRLKPNEAIELENALFDPFGGIYKRPGYTYFGGASQEPEEYDSIVCAVLNIYAKKRGNAAFIVGLHLYEETASFFLNSTYNANQTISLSDDFATYSATSWIINMTGGDSTRWEMWMFDSLQTWWTYYPVNQIRTVDINYSVLGVIYDCGEVSCTTFCLPDGQDSCRWYDSTGTDWQRVDDYPGYGSDNVTWHSGEDDTGAGSVFIVTYANSNDYVDSNITKVLLQTRVGKGINHHPCTTTVNTGLWVTETPYRYGSDFVLPTDWDGDALHPESVFVAEWTVNPHTTSSWSDTEVDGIASYYVVPRSDVAGDIVIDEMWITAVTYKNDEWFRNYYLFPRTFEASGGALHHCNCGDDLWSCIDYFPGGDACTLYFDRSNLYGYHYYDSLAEPWDSVTAGLDTSITLCATDPFNFLHRLYLLDDSKYLMAGGDTALYVLTDSCFEYVTGTGGISGLWDGCTYKDYFVGTHSGIKPVFYNGTTLLDLSEDIIDSFRVTSATNIGADYCTLKVICDEPGWVVNEWVGYVVYYGDATGSNYSFVLSNTTTTLYAMGVAGLLPGGGSYIYVKPLFYTTLVASGDVLDTAIDVGMCFTDLMLDTTFTTGMFNMSIDSAYIVYLSAGSGAGQRLFIYQNDGDTITCNGRFYEPADTSTDWEIYTIGFYEAEFVEVFDSRLWLGSIGEAKNRVVYSDVAELWNFPPENNIYFESEVGDYINGLATLYDEGGGFEATPKQVLLVFQTNHIYKILPTNTADVYITTRLASGVGCVAPHTITSIAGRGLAFLHWSGVYFTDAERVVLISDKIDPIIEGMNKDQFEKCAAVYNPEDKHYYISYPDTGSSVNNKTLAFGIDFKAWSRETVVGGAWANQPGISDSVKLIFADADSPYVYWYGCQADDDTTGVVLTYQTPYFDFGTPPYYDKWVGFGALEVDSDTGYIYIDWYKDYSTLAYSDSILATGQCRIQNQLTEDVLGKNISMKITTEAAIDNFRLTIWDWKYRVLTERR